MKTVRWDEKDKKKCDFCKSPTDKVLEGIDHDGTAYYDAPTKNGSWAYMCEEHFKLYGLDHIGTKFDYQPVAEPLREVAAKASSMVSPLSVGAVLAHKAVQPQLGEELCDLEEQLFGDRMIGCPDCGCERHVEPDATYTFDCEGCGIPVKCPTPMM
jgi:hypothetical protein